MCQTLYIIGSMTIRTVLYAIKWIKLILGCTSPEMTTALYMRPNLGPIQGQSMFWREVLSHSVHGPTVSFRSTWPCFPDDRDTDSHSKHSKLELECFGRLLIGQMGFFLWLTRKLVSSSDWIEPSSFHPMRKHSRGMPQLKTQVCFGTGRRCP